MNSKQKNDAIDSAENLTELFKIISEPCEDEDDESNIKYSELPSFGGEAPKKTSAVWSWDKTHLIVSEGDFKLVERCACGEADFHCLCAARKAAYD